MLMMFNLARRFFIEGGIFVKEFETEISRLITFLAIFSMENRQKLENFRSFT